MIIELLKCVPSGLAAGLAATAVMDTGQGSLIPAVSQWWQARGRDDEPEGAEPRQGEAAGASEAAPESSPARVARRAAELAGIELSTPEAERYGNLVHWLYGAQWGAAYLWLLLLAGRLPGPRSGLLYGAALWLGSDELLLWALGIAKAPSAYPLSVHLEALAAHGLYGLALGVFARGLR